MRAAVAVLVIGLSLGSACASTGQGRADARAAAAAEANRANELVRAGCYDCLLEALQTFERLSKLGVPNSARRASETAALLAIRERELGLVDQGHLARARAGATGPETFPLDVIATLSRRSAGMRRANSDADVRARATGYQNREAWQTRLRPLASRHLFGAAVALALECAYPASTGAPAVEPVSTAAADSSALVRFMRSTCGTWDAAALGRLLRDDPRFVEVTYFLGLTATMSGNLEEADAQFAKAFAWRQDWPALTFALANTALTAEDFSRAVDFYRRTLTLDSGNVDAELGLLRALSYAGDHHAAVTIADRLIAARWHAGDAYYWRAWNRAQLQDVEGAWTDVLQAATLIFNAEVPKLTGILAAHRGDVLRARDEFMLARERAPDDCETATLLGRTHVALAGWDLATRTLSEAVACLDARAAALKAEIAKLKGSGSGERLIPRRHRELAENARLRAQVTTDLATAKAAQKR